MRHRKGAWHVLPNNWEKTVMRVACKVVRNAIDPQASIPKGRMNEKGMQMDDGRGYVG